MAHLRRSSVHRQIMRVMALIMFAQVIVCSTTWLAEAQQSKTPYPKMAPAEQYLMPDRNAEISLARSAAPGVISRVAEVMVLGRHGYEVAAKGTNGFLCLVERSWTGGINDRDFWNPRLRAPICFNPAGARSYVPITVMKSKLVLEGKSKAEMFRAVESAIDKKELAPMEAGTMCYMMSKQQYLGDEAKSWHPHLMFFVSNSTPKDWGANLAGSPVLASEDAEDRMTVFMIPVGHWSDGTAAPLMK